MLNLQSLQPSSCSRLCQSPQLPRNARPPRPRAAAVQAVHATGQQLKRQGSSSPQTTDPAVPKQHQRQLNSFQQQPAPRHRHHHHHHHRHNDHGSQTSSGCIGAQGGLGDEQQEEQVPQDEEGGWDGAVYEHYDSLGYEQQLVALRQMLTPDKIAQIRATSTSEELQQLDLVLQDVQKLSELEAAHQSSSASSSLTYTTLSGDQNSLATAATPPPPQMSRRRSSRRINVASRLAEERRMAAAAAPSQPSINADFYSYLQTEVFQGADGEEMREILDTLGQAQVEQLASVYNEMRSFVHQPPEQLAQKYAELSSHMDALMAAAPEGPEEMQHQGPQQHLQHQEQQQQQFYQQGMPAVRNASEEPAARQGLLGEQHVGEGAGGGVWEGSWRGGVAGGGRIGDPSWDPWAEQEGGGGEEPRQQEDQGPWQLQGSHQGHLQGSYQEPVFRTSREVGATFGESVPHKERKSDVGQEELPPPNGLQRRWKGRVGRARGALFPKKVS